MVCQLAPMGTTMDDVQAFVKMKMEEYLLTKNKTDVSTTDNKSNLTELNKILEKICKHGMMKVLKICRRIG